VKVQHVVSAFALILGATTVAAAQDAQPPQGPPPGEHGPGGPGRERGGPGRMMERLFEGITLTDAQKDSIKKLNQAHADARKAQWEKNKPDGNQRPDSATMAKFREDMMKQMVQERNEIRAVLTADQQAVFDKNVAKMEADMKARMERRKNGGDGAPAPLGQ